MMKMKIDIQVCYSIYSLIWNWKMAVLKYASQLHKFCISIENFKAQKFIQNKIIKLKWYWINNEMEFYELLIKIFQPQISTHKKCTFNATYVLIKH